MKATSETNALITGLLDHAQEKGLIRRSDRIYFANLICERLGVDSYARDRSGGRRPLHGILEDLCSIARSEGIIPEGTAASDRFDTLLMGILTPRPSDVNRAFSKLYKKDPRAASDYFYRLAKDSNYIRTDRIARDMRWKVGSEYGDIDISINLSKPEKDPRDIAAAKSAPQNGYPKCLLCRENVGYAGDPLKPARQNLRQIPVRLGGERWLMQYSPYVYYNEHCIVLSPRHVPMSITRDTFVRMFDFVTFLPHYFIGSNADLPIVGGSILSHDHMQGGCYEFPMERAGSAAGLRFEGYPQIEASIVNWPMSVIRLRSSDREPLTDLSEKLLAAWRAYSDPSAGIFAETDGVPHNTVTPIARRRGADYEIDLVLRNNLTTEEYPMGVFHPHSDKHNIKKENIGLIEVMGLAILPARLRAELTALAGMLVSGAPKEEIAADPVCGKHAAWAESFRDRYEFTSENALGILKEETGKVFTAVLEDSGVFKKGRQGREAFLRFAASAGAGPVR